MDAVDLDWYAQRMNPLPEDIAQELTEVVESSVQSLRQLDDARAASRPAPGKWSIKEIIGHLIDSAANNHQRFVRACDCDELVFPKYEQDFWVRVQGYETGPWPELLDLWQLYNRHLARVIVRIPAAKRGVVCKIDPDPPVSLMFLIEDYLVHMKHHLGQIERQRATRVH